MVLNGKTSQEYPVNAEVLQGSILGPTIFLLFINDLPNDVICNIAICAEVWSGIWSVAKITVGCWTWISSTTYCRLGQRVARKTQFDFVWPVLEEKSSFKMLGLSFSSKSNCGSYIISIATTASKKIGAFIRSMKFLFPRLFAKIFI